MTDVLCCPFCLSMDPNKVGVERATGKVCRDPFHCPVPDSHSDNGGPFRYCQYCDWREDESKEPPAGAAVAWAVDCSCAVHGECRDCDDTCPCYPAVGQGGEGE